MESFILAMTRDGYVTLKTVLLIWLPLVPLHVLAKHAFTDRGLGRATRLSLGLLGVLAAVAVFVTLLTQVRYE